MVDEAVTIERRQALRVAANLADSLPTQPGRLEAQGFDTVMIKYDLFVDTLALAYSMGKRDAIATVQAMIK